MNLPTTISVFAGKSGSHLQGIAIDKNREYIYCSFTTCLVKCDLTGKIIGSVKGICGHLGCIAYNYSNGFVYGSLEFKADSIGKGILDKLGYSGNIQDGFYAVRFDVSKIVRLDMDAEKDGIMEAVFLKDVYDDYKFEGHKYGCSGIDGLTFAHEFGDKSTNEFLYVAYGIYGDVNRNDNDYQVILKYDQNDLDKYFQKLDQQNMHRYGPEAAASKYFLYTGNTTYGIQNLEYDSYSDSIIAAVYQGKKERFPNYPMFFIDCSKKPVKQSLMGINESGDQIFLTDFSDDQNSDSIVGSRFPYGSTGIASLGDGCFYISESFRNDDGYGGIIKLYKFDQQKLTFNLI